MHQNTPPNMVHQVEQVTRMNRGSFPLKYLGCPLTHSKKKKEHYAELIDNVSKLQVWMGSLLNFLKVCLILKSIPLYLISAVVPPKSVLKEVQKIFTNKEKGKSKHWVTWNKLCFTKQEGDLGFRSLTNVSQAMHAKLWWRFRTQE